MHVCMGNVNVCTSSQSIVDFRDKSVAAKKFEN